MVGQNPSFSVSEFVAIFNQSLEMMYPQVTVIGELANFRVSKGRWVYYDLKDDYASVRFFGSVHRLPGPLEDGIMCEVFGRPYLHPQYGFSIQFDTIRPVGEGALRRAQDLLFKKLDREGIFAQVRKRALPYPPERVGLITSAESAAIADFQKIIGVRWPRLKIDLIDTLVQGTSAPASIIHAIQEFNMSSNPPEVLVLIRGGGSADDLAAFSEESVVRAVASSRIPTMVAIGHESDTSLAELAADKTGSTPSNAAELLVPDLKHESFTINKAKLDINENVKRLFAREADLIKHEQSNLQRQVAEIFNYHRHEIANQKILLKALDPMQPLEQGYALVRSETGKHIKRAAQLSGSSVFSLEFSDDKKFARLVDDRK